MRFYPSFITRHQDSSQELSVNKVDVGILIFLGDISIHGNINIRLRRFGQSEIKFTPFAFKGTPLDKYSSTIDLPTSYKIGSISQLDLHDLHRYPAL